MGSWFRTMRKYYTKARRFSSTATPDEIGWRADKDIKQTKLSKWERIPARKDK